MSVQNEKIRFVYYLLHHSLPNNYDYYRKYFKKKLFHSFPTVLEPVMGLCIGKGIGLLRV